MAEDFELPSILDVLYGLGGDGQNPAEAPVRGVPYEDLSFEEMEERGVRQEADIREQKLKEHLKKNPLEAYQVKDIEKGWTGLFWDKKKRDWFYSKIPGAHPDYPVVKPGQQVPRGQRTREHQGLAQYLDKSGKLREESSSQRLERDLDAPFFYLGIPGLTGLMGVIGGAPFLGRAMRGGVSSAVHAGQPVTPASASIRSAQRATGREMEQYLTAAARREVEKTILKQVGKRQRDVLNARPRDIPAISDHVRDARRGMRERRDARDLIFRERDKLSTYLKDLIRKQGNLLKVTDAQLYEENNRLGYGDGSWASEKKAQRDLQLLLAFKMKVQDKKWERLRKEPIPDPDIIPLTVPFSDIEGLPTGNVPGMYHKDFGRYDEYPVGPYDTTAPRNLRGMPTVSGANIDRLKASILADIEAGRGFTARQDVPPGQVTTPPIGAWELATPTDAPPPVWGGPAEEMTPELEKMARDAAEKRLRQGPMADVMAADAVVPPDHPASQLDAVRANFPDLSEEKQREIAFENLSVFGHVNDPFPVSGRPTERFGVMSWPARHRLHPFTAPDYPSPQRGEGHHRYYAIKELLEEGKITREQLGDVDIEMMLQRHDLNTPGMWIPPSLRGTIPSDDPRYWPDAPFATGVTENIRRGLSFPELPGHGSVGADYMPHTPNRSRLRTRDTPLSPEVINEVEERLLESQRRGTERQSAQWRGQKPDPTELDWSTMDFPGQRNRYQVTSQDHEGHMGALGKALEFALEEEARLAGKGTKVPDWLKFLLAAGAGAGGTVAAGTLAEEEEVPVPSPLDRMLPDAPTE